MFNSITEARDFVLNSGWLEAINLDEEKEIVEDVYRNAESEEHANEIIENYLS